jgi:hypothetical protein
MFAPMTQGELLDGAFHLYGRHFRTLIAVAAVCNGPGQALSLYADLSGGVTVRPFSFVVALLVAGIGALIGSAAILRVISDGYLGRESSWQEAIRFAMGKVWSLIVANFAAGMLTGLALLLLIVPGIIVACGYSVVSQVVVLEDLPSPTDALSRSWALTKDHRVTAFVMMLVLGLVAGMPGGIANALSVFLGSPARVVGALLAIALAPLASCGMTLYYYDLRVRKEAFDLQILGQLLGPST